MGTGKGPLEAIRKTRREVAGRAGRGGFALGLLLLLTACAGVPPVPYAPPPPLNQTSDLRLREPDSSEVVVVVNDNNNQVHAGMFVGSTLVDPAGSYLRVRGGERDWPGVTLKDYIHFQLEDGPEVRLYRFHLSGEALASLKTRVEQVGFTPPLFCAAKVQNLISGIPPFQNVPDAWLVSPAVVGQHLDVILRDNRASGVCNWPDGSSCYAGTAIMAR